MAVLEGHMKIFMLSFLLLSCEGTKKITSTRSGNQSAQTSPATDNKTPSINAGSNNDQISAPSDDPLAKKVIDQNDFEYIGAFLLPTTDGGQWSTSYGMTGLAHRYVNGKLQFFTGSHVYSGGLIYEIDYPGTTKVAPYPQAKVVKYWGDVYSGKKWTDGEGGGAGGAGLGGGVWTYGLYYDESLKRLYRNYGHWYNAENPYNPSMGYSDIDDQTGVATGIGAWRMKDRPEKYARGGVMPIPQWFVDKYTNGKNLGIGFGGYFSITNSASLGLALAAINHPDIAKNPDKSSLENTPMMGFPISAPDRGHRNTDYKSEYDGGKWNPENGVGYWTWSDEQYGAARWIETPTKHGVIFISMLGQGRVWYETSDRHQERRSITWFSIDPKDLADSAQGKKKEYEVQPKYEWMDPNITFGNSNGISYDPTTKRLYVLMAYQQKIGCCESYPYVYVYQIKD